MKFGMNLLLWTGELHDGMIPVLEMLKHQGYDGVELPIFNTGLDYKKWGKRLDDLGLCRTAVTVRTADDNPISSDAGVRRKGIEGTCKPLDCCAAVGATARVGAEPTPAAVAPRSPWSAVPPRATTPLP